jgi:glycosyltransferase involved in cell wall biosynthesis
VKIVFWLSIIGILYTYLGYPAVIWLLARLRPRPWTVKAISPSVSIVLAVYNGAALLPRKIEHLLGLDYPNIKEIIIVSDGSTDGTAELLVSQSHPRLTTIILNEHAGKAVAVNAGVARATGDVILFVDIRPEIAPGAIQQLVSNFADPKVGCAAGKLILRQKNHDASSAAMRNGSEQVNLSAALRSASMADSMQFAANSLCHSQPESSWMTCFCLSRLSTEAIDQFSIHKHVLMTPGQQELKTSFIARCEHWQETSSSSIWRIGR